MKLSSRRETRRALPLILSLSFLTGWLSATAAPATQSKVFDFGQHGTITLDLPGSWSEDRPSSDQPALLHLRYRAPGNRNFEMRISVLPETVTDDPGGPIVEIGRRTVAVGEGWLSRTVEKAVDLHPIDGPGLTGYYFMLTDRTSPLPAGEFKYITQGLGLAHELTQANQPAGHTLEVAFTLFSNDGQATLVQQGLAVVKSARLGKPR